MGITFKGAVLFVPATGKVVCRIGEESAGPDYGMSPNLIITRVRNADTRLRSWSSPVVCWAVAEVWTSG